MYPGIRGLPLRCATVGVGLPVSCKFLRLTLWSWHCLLQGMTMLVIEGWMGACQLWARGVECIA